MQWYAGSPHSVTLLSRFLPEYAYGCPLNGFNANNVFGFSPIIDLNRFYVPGSGS
jgi:hypothetical protein